MSTIAQLPGADPQHSVSVQASAGSGKTWLLVTRLTRLLLDGCAPDAILALTFTNKAAGEMLSRLHERLAQLARVDDAELDIELNSLGLAATATRRELARGLYERLLNNPFPLRATTFHAFCQELLQRFALDAGVPPGFDLLEDESEHKATAWAKLLSDCSRERQRGLGAELHAFLSNVGSLASAEAALLSFLDHRPDWWAYRAGRSLSEVEAEIVQQFSPPESREQALSSLFARVANRATLEAYAGAMSEYGTATLLKLRAQVLEALASSDLHESFTALHGVVLTQSNTARNHERSRNAMQKKLGAAKADAFFDTHYALAEALLHTADALHRYSNCQLTLHWLRLGDALVENYQQLKAERRQLDFNDLEWHACQLLRDPEMGHWVQYKLDARIEHILVDEFQDTSPSQWQLLHPLLEEISAGDAERRRSAFIVGDAKQSIYAFRRADPRLLDAATEQLQQQANARVLSLSKSWRSSSVIMELVNRVFAAKPEQAALIEGFPEHATHLSKRWGAVYLLPQLDGKDDTPTDNIANDNIANDNSDNPAKNGEAAQTLKAIAQEATRYSAPELKLRDPLKQARVVPEDRRQQLEAEQIAAQIQQLIAEQTPIEQAEGNRPVRYGDMRILLRKRSHAGSIERALRAAGIPFQGTDRHSFNNSIEVQDIFSLLRLLNSPWDNLATAQVLRSPLFSFTDANIIELATAASGPWLLSLLEKPLSENANEQRAQTLLGHWYELAGRLPVHDLLDLIFAEGEVEARYLASFPSQLHGRIQHNFAQLFRLALSTDSGRYPSLSRFLNKSSNISKDPFAGDEDSVRIMTIHSAKGLEAPVVFLANAAMADSSKDAWKALVDWPPGADRPSHFALRLPQKQSDTHLNTLASKADVIAEREGLNLLYVALTRARQLLFVSGFPPQKGSAAASWYQLIEQALSDCTADEQGRLSLHSSAEQPELKQTQTLGDEIDSELATIPELASLAFSKNSASAQNENETSKETAEPELTLPDEANASRRGTAIHQLLEYCAAGSSIEAAAARLGHELNLAANDAELQHWAAEVSSVLECTDCAWVFANGVQAWNEVPVWNASKSRYSVIDRLVKTNDALWIIDYKTQRITTAEAKVAAATHRQQLNHYVEAIQLIWPEQTIKKALLFTAVPLLFEL